MFRKLTTWSILLRRHELSTSFGSFLLPSSITIFQCRFPNPITGITCNISSHVLASKNENISENKHDRRYSDSTYRNVFLHVMSMHMLVTAVFDCLFLHHNNFIKAGKHATTVDYCGFSTISGCKYGLRKLVLSNSRREPQQQQVLNLSSPLAGRHSDRLKEGGGERTHTP